ncbi:MFS transporter [Phormidium tenue]|uniref:MFS transporter n=1 Tax=Phormidium tenue NIES-30 TaxID=549789 RepID=A0A1U7J5L7_9CYAN|nr:MFS transporter [Phormidium tenue]MBD2232468.1 MFS transporter [Phormidium tenue FACHB-1052]OKH48048.1 MFS transporter [Phormidium tenue NIES-30]
MASNPPFPAAAPAKFSLWGKLAFGAGDIGPGMTANLLSFSFLIFLTTAAGLSPVAAGSVLAIGRIWDAFNDPFIGYLSDKTRTRWGRRYPWIVLGAIPFGVTFFLTWVVPDWGDTARFWYYVVMSLLFQVFYTVVNLPYTTLTAELTKDYDERTELTAFRLGSSLFGAIAALGLGLVITQVIADQRQQYLVLGGICAVLSVLPLLWCVWGTYPCAVQRNALQPAETDEAALPFLQQIKVVFSNRAFVFVVGIYLFAWLALQMTASIIPFYATFWMGLDSYFLAALLVQGTAIVMMGVVNYLSRRLGKQEVFYIGIGTWIIAQIALFFVQPGQVAALYLLCIVISFGVATAYVVPWAMLPDVIELDEIKTGQRREGIFYAFMTLLQKVGLALGLLLVGLALQSSGFVSEAAQQSDSALLAIRIFIGPVPMVLLAMSMLLTRFYPITRQMHQEMLLKLAERDRNQEPHDTHDSNG